MGAADIAVTRFLGAALAGARGGREVYEADRLFRRSAARARNPGDRDRQVNRTAREHPINHCKRSRAADRSMLVQSLKRNAERRVLGIV
jgi:hypothetical protein